MRLYLLHSSCMGWLGVILLAAGQKVLFSLCFAWFQWLGKSWMGFKETFRMFSAFLRQQELCSSFREGKGQAMISWTVFPILWSDFLCAVVQLENHTQTGAQDALNITAIGHWQFLRNVIISEDSAEPSMSALLCSQHRTGPSWCKLPGSGSLTPIPQLPLM